MHTTWNSAASGLRVTWIWGYSLVEEGGNTAAIGWDPVMTVGWESLKAGEGGTPKGELSPGKEVYMRGLV